MKFLLVSALLIALIASASAVSTQAQIDANDLNVLQYALTLERLEAAFYAQGQQIFNSTSFQNAGLSLSDYNYLGVIAAHEQAHVNFLVGVINSVNGVPVTACSYTFGNAFASVQSYIATALTLESTGVAAYDGAINTITNKVYVEAAATIATIEGRHAQYLFNLNANLTNTAYNIPGVGSAGAFEQTYTPSQVSTNAAVLGFLNGCEKKLTALPANTFNLATTNFTTSAGASVGSDVVTANDIKVLQFALTLEHLENAFYTFFQAKYNNVANFTSAGYSASAFTYLNLVKAHESAHVAFLQTALGSAAVSPCSYDFSSITSVQQYINTAALLEPVGTAAYDGAAPAITNRDYLTAAATIAAIEARHAAILAVLASQVTTPTTSPFFNQSISFEPAQSAATVVANVASLGFITSPATDACRTYLQTANFPVVYTQTSNYTAPVTTTTQAPSSSSASILTGSLLFVFAAVAAFLL